MATSILQQQAQDQTIQDWQLGKNLGDCMKELYDRNLWSDVKFRCKDHAEGESIRAHKVILAARSPFFQAMFYGPCAERNEEVELKETEKNIFDLFLRYVYTDTLSVEEDTASPLLSLAHMYQVPVMVQLIADYLENIIKVENACEMLQLATFYRIATLKEACCRFIDQNVIAVINSDGFMNLSGECLLYLLKGDTFYADEELIVAKVDEWACRKLKEQGLNETGENLRRVLGESFYYLRLPCLTYQNLAKFVRSKGYLSASEFMAIADHINGIPDTNVESNSSLTRVRMIETLNLSMENGDYQADNQLSCSFSIQVSRNVKLLELSLCSIEPFLQFYSEHFKVTPGKTRKIQFDKTSLEDFFSKSMEPNTMVLVERNTWTRTKGTVNALEKLRELSLPLAQVGEVTLSVENFHQVSKITIGKDCTPIISLTDPLILKKRDQAYRCNIQIKFPYQDYRKERIVMKVCETSRDTVSKVGNVRVSTSSFSILKNIKIQSFANRSAEKSRNNQQNSQL